MRPSTSPTRVRVRSDLIVLCLGAFALDALTNRVERFVRRNREADRVGAVAAVVGEAVDTVAEFVVVDLR